MSKQAFIKNLSENKRETAKGATTFATEIRVIYPKHLLESGKYDEDKLKKSHESGGKSKRAIQSSKKLSSGGYTFLWVSAEGVDEKKAAQTVSELSRKHIQAMMTDDFKKRVDIQKEPGTYQKGESSIQKTGQSQVGGHVVSSAFLQLLRKAIAINLITQEEANQMIEEHARGQASFVINDVESDRHGKTVQVYEDTNYFGMTYDEIKEVDEVKGMNYNLNAEVMFPISDDANKEQLKFYETQSINNLKKELEGLVFSPRGDKVLETEGSHSLERMMQEIIAAKLLGKKAPKYRGGNTWKAQKAKTVSKRRQVRVKEGNKVEAKRAFAAQAKALKARTASPMSIVNLLNQRLPQEFEENMGEPGLVNRTGRLARSVRVVNFLRGRGRGNLPTIQYTYEQDPYSVFEMGGRGDSRWSTRERDPRVLAEKSIRDLAAELMMKRFKVQRL